MKPYASLNLEKLQTKWEGKQEKEDAKEQNFLATLLKAMHAISVWISSSFPLAIGGMSLSLSRVPRWKRAEI